MTTEFIDYLQMVNRSLQLLAERMQLSHLDAVESYPRLGFVVAPLRSERTRFLVYVRNLIDRGVPQLIPNTVYDYQDDHGYSVLPFWLVGGVPSKTGKSIAEQWMNPRSQNWDGDAKALRHEVERALVAGEEIPKFGLNILLLILMRY